jgi:dTDP-4-amino-4,6-dideoxygalactose transaminase
VTNKIPLYKVFLPPKEELMPRLEEVLYSGFLSEGAIVKEFEEALQRSLGISYLRPLTTNSCTAALQMAYRCSDVKGKVVLATPMTCVATNMPILEEGGDIVWCDIDPETGNIDPASVTAKMKEYGDRVAAISFVDFGGYPADINRLDACRPDKCKVKLIEDAAQSLFASYDVKEYPVMYRCTVGADSRVDFVCLSFQAIKHLTTCDGGALITPNLKDWRRAKSLKWFGIDRDKESHLGRWYQEIPEVGYKFHMNNVNAAIGMAQLKHIANTMHRHRLNGSFLDSQLAEIDGIQPVKVSQDAKPSYWVYLARVERRKDFIKAMKAAGIGVDVPFFPNNFYSCFDVALNAKEDLPGLEKFNESYVAIPCGWWVSDTDRRYIVETIKRGW